MIKCYFVDVKSISSDVARSNFDESELDRLADLILETDGLIRPLILREIGVEKYTLIEGHREYYAAVIAKEKDLGKAEMVNAFVIKPSIQQIAIDQLQLLSGHQQPISNPVIAVDLKDSAIEKLSSLISEQMQPLHQEITKLTAQLVEHKEILESFKSSLKIDRKPTIVDPKPPMVDLEQIDKNNTVKLINTLSLTDLSVRMQEARIPKAVQLATSIIAARNKQADNKFDRWERFVSEVKGLGPKTAKSIVEKFKLSNLIE